MLFAKFASRRRETLILAASLASCQFLQKVKIQLQLQMARRGCLWGLLEPLGRLWNAAGSCTAGAFASFASATAAATAGPLLLAAATAGACAAAAAAAVSAGAAFAVVCCCCCCWYWH